MSDKMTGITHRFGSDDAEILSFVILFMVYLMAMLSVVENVQSWIFVKCYEGSEGNQLRR